jgi:hypothetical protein
MANDLTPINARPLAKTASEECSGALWRRLTSENLTWSDAIRDLAEDPTISGELTVVAKQLARHVEPCGGKWVISLLAPLLTLYGVSDKTEAEAAAFWGFYIDALGGLPREAVKRGVADYVAAGNSEFFPKPGPLKALCERHAIPIRMAENRARKALEVR